MPGTNETEWDLMEKPEEEVETDYLIEGLEAREELKPILSPTSSPSRSKKG